MATIKARGANPPYKKARLSAFARVKDLLSRMTLEEKFGVEPGDFEIVVGNSRADFQKLILTVTK